MVPLKNSSGIIAGIDWDKMGVMTYEAIIPFKTFYKDKITMADNTKVFSIVIFIPGITGGGPGGVGPSTSGGEMGGGRGGSGGGGGRGGRGGGGMGGKYTGFSGDPGASNPMAESNFMSIKFKPAVVTK